MLWSSLHVLSMNILDQFRYLSVRFKHHYFYKFSHIKLHFMFHIFFHMFFHFFFIFTSDVKGYISALMIAMILRTKVTHKVS